VAKSVFKSGQKPGKSGQKSKIKTVFTNIFYDAFAKPTLNRAKAHF
jgi:hypothetical protein